MAERKEILNSYFFFKVVLTKWFFSFNSARVTPFVYSIVTTVVLSLREWFNLLLNLTLTFHMFVFNYFSNLLFGSVV